MNKIRNKINLIKIINKTKETKKYNNSVKTKTMMIWIINMKNPQLLKDKCNKLQNFSKKINIL